MNPVILFWSLPVLATIACVLSFYAQKLYIKVYERYISFEPSSQFRVPFSKHASVFLIFMIAFMLVPTLLWVQGQDNSYAFIFLCGYAIAFLASWISRSISALFIYRYLQYHSNLVSGQAIFKSPLTQVINAGMVFQQLAFMAIVTFFIPSSAFTVGILCGLAALVLIHYLSKNRTAATSF